MSAYKVGQELYYEPFDARDRNNRMVRIIKIGRKWLELDGTWSKMRADIETLLVDGGKYSPPGQCYLSREARETEVLLLKGWRDLAKQIDGARTVPDGVTFEDIGKARELLRLGAS